MSNDEQSKDNEEDETDSDDEDRHVLKFDLFSSNMYFRLFIFIYYV